MDDTVGNLIPEQIRQLCVILMQSLTTEEIISALQEALPPEDLAQVSRGVMLTAE